jgi:SAM-dependent methyltransferase
MREPDAVYADPRQAILYDVFEDDRSDLDAYVAIVRELGARSVIDIGCGTGSLAVRLAALGLDVVGVDPAAASLEVARGKPYADRVGWVVGDATALRGRRLGADLAVMTGNVAQVFVADDDWHLTLEAVSACLLPGGWFVFETRRPDVRDWESWGTPPTTVHVPGATTAVTSMAVTEVALPLVTFVSETVVDGEALRSVTTLRFRDRAEIERDLVAHGFEVVDVRDAPDRPGKEFVFMSRSLGDADHPGGTFSVASKP